MASTNPSGQPLGAPTEHIAAMPEDMIRALSQRYATNDMEEISRMLASEQLMHHYGPHVQYLTTARAAIKDPKTASKSSYGTLTEADRDKAIGEVHKVAEEDWNFNFANTKNAVDQITTYSTSSGADPHHTLMAKFLKAKMFRDREMAVHENPEFKAYKSMYGSDLINTKYDLIRKRREDEYAKLYDDIFGPDPTADGLIVKDMLDKGISHPGWTVFTVPGAGGGTPVNWGALDPIINDLPAPPAGP